MKIKQKPSRPERLLNIEHVICDLSQSDLEGSVDEVIEKLGALKAQYSQYCNLTIKVETDYDYTQVNLVGYTDEPEIEYLARLSKYDKKLAEYEGWYALNKELIVETLDKRRARAKAAKDAQIARLEKELRKLRKS